MKSCNKQAEQWKTTIDLLCLNREEGHAEAGKIIRFIRGKSVLVFHCSTFVLQDYCNLLYLVLGYCICATCPWTAIHPFFGLIIVLFEVYMFEL